MEKKNCVLQKEMFKGLCSLENLFATLENLTEAVAKIAINCLTPEITDDSAKVCEGDGVAQCVHITKRPNSFRLLNFRSQLKPRKSFRSRNYP
jgi:hypothetical protein